MQGTETMTIKQAQALKAAIELLPYTQAAVNDAIKEIGTVSSIDSHLEKLMKDRAAELQSFLDTLTAYSEQ